MAAVKTDSRHYFDIAEKIRERSETSKQYKPSEMAEGIDLACAKTYENGYTEGHTFGISEGYDIGSKNEYDRFWNEFQDYGNRTDYGWSFRCWGGDYIRPKYKIQTFTFRSDSMFQLSRVKKIEAAYFDFSGINSLPNNSPNGATYCMFNASKRLEEIEDLNIPAGNYHSTWHNCTALKKIAVVRISADNTFTNAFNNCTALEEVTFSGTLAKNGLNLQYSPKLNRASIESVINVLSTSTSGLKVTLSKAAVNKAFETAVGANDGVGSAEWTALIATKSNWTISLI